MATSADADIGLRVIFMGAPDFAARQLDALSAAGVEVAAVYTQPPRPAGRGKKLRPTAVAARAEALGLETRWPESFRDPAEIESLRALGADVAVVVAYGLLLPQAALDAPRLGCVNLHASLLPRWRGAAPIQRAIMAGDAETGVCAMRMTKGLDEGPVFGRVATPIADDETTGSLHDRLAELAAPLMLATLRDLEAGRAVATEQADAGAIYAKKIAKAEAELDWSRGAAEIDRKIRGLSPAPGAWTLARFGDAQERVKILNSRVEPAAAEAPPGTLLDDALLVAAGDGAAVRLLSLQRAGRGAQDAATFLRGQPVAAGARLGPIEEETPS